MANWKKVIVSGSNASLNHITASGAVSASGNLFASLTTDSSNLNTVMYNTTTGQFFHTGSYFAAQLPSGILSSSLQNFTSYSSSVQTLISNATASIAVNETNINILEASASAGIYISASVNGGASIGLMQTASFIGGAGITTTYSSTGKITISSDTGELTSPVAISASNGITSLAYGGTASFEAAGTGLAAGQAGGLVTYTVDPAALVESVDTATVINITSSWVENFTSTQILSISGAIDAATGSLSASIIGTANEVEVTANATNIIVGLPDNVTIAGTLDINGATLATGQTTFNLLDTTATTINFGGAATTIDIGAAGASNVNILGSASIAGDLIVRGTTTSINTTNLNVEDPFILLNSGSTSGDGGIIIQTGAGGVGTALFFDDSISRWGLTKKDDTAWNVTTTNPRQFIVSVSSSAGIPTSTPSDFGGNDASRYGMMYVDSSNADGDGNTIWIFGA
jgi:hypothetical protein